MANDKQLAAAAAALAAAESELDDLQRRLDGILRDAEQAAAALAQTLEGVDVDELLRAAEQQAAARHHIDAAEMAAAELRKRIARQQDVVKRCRAHHGGLVVEVEQAKLDARSWQIVELLQQAIEQLELQRQTEQELARQTGVTPIVTFPSELLVSLKHRVEWAGRELAGRQA